MNEQKKASLAVTHRNLVEEWDINKNSPLTPFDVTAGMTKIVWWKCSKGHEWEAAIGNRAKGNGCPYCSGRYVVAGETDLISLRPDIANEWNYEKNVYVVPESVSVSSNRKVWWKCSKGHEWEATISSRTSGRNCPYCSNRKILIGFNDLATVVPKLADEWNYEKNGEMKPTDCVFGSSKKVWWKCAKGHEWAARINHRANGSDCPFCSGRKAISGQTDFETSYPELMIEWNYERNEAFKPSELTKSSGQKVWWKCSKGHEWQAIISNRAKGHGCPYCSGQKALSGFNDLLTIKPDYLDEWDYKRNIGVNPKDYSVGSGKKVWWKCSKGHEWQATICSRTRGNGCPRCQYIGSSKPEQGIVYYLSKSCRVESRIQINKQEIDIYLPDYKIGIEYDGRFYHKNSLSKEISKDKIVKEAGVTLFRVKESDHNLFLNNTVFFVTDYLGPNYVWALHTLFEQIADLSGVKELMFIDIDPYRDSLEIRAQYALIQLENSLATKYPQIAKEWNFEKNGDLTPEMFYPASSEKVWWKCSNGHEWKSVIYSRVSGSGCPYCSGRAAITGKTDFLTLNPELAKEWNFERNQDINPSLLTVSSGRLVWWKCSRGHEWQSTLHSRTAGHGCPYCSGKLVLKGFNDLQSTRPELASEWNYDKNVGLIDKRGHDISKPDKVTAVSGQKVWWKCAVGHEWEAMISNRAKGRGCPYCVGKRVQVGFNDLETSFPLLAKEWNYEKNGDLKPANVTASSGQKVWWKCSKGHEWQALISNRSRLGRGCPYCAGQRVIPGVSDLLSTNPSLASEWNYPKNNGLVDGKGRDISTPDKIMPSSISKVWWKCSEGHEWKTSVNNRANGHGCPFCANNVVKSIVNIETGEIYKSSREAALSCGIKDSGQIAACCRGECKTAGGFHWKYIENNSV